MAPRGPAKARDYDYSNVGKAGRRTGITLKEGRRDEHGMEEVDGIFSSPEKSPAHESGFDDSTGSDGMSMDEGMHCAPKALVASADVGSLVGNGPGPDDFLNSINGNRAPYFPPPVARSPMKTGLTGSPRRTPGLRSSQSPQRDIPSSSPSDGKGLASAKGESRRDVSPLTNRSANVPNGTHNRGNKRPEKATSVSSDSEVDGDENGDSFDQVQSDFADSFVGGDDHLNGDDSNDEDQDNTEAEPSLTKTTQKRGRPPQKTAKASGAKASEAATRDQRDHQDSAQKRKRPGRPPKAQSKPSDDMEEQRPAKKSKTSAPKNRTTSSGDPELDKVVENYVNRTGPLKGRSLYILKREAPTDSTAKHTRSGRISVRPLAYWKNERCVYGDGEAAEGQRFPLSTIKEIIRTEELEPEKKKANRRSKKSKSKKDDDSDDDDEQHRDPYEKKGGVLHGYIRKWDPDTQTALDQEEILDIAYAPSGIETRDVKGATFRFAKLLSSPFIGSGIVELPPGGVKKPKNSKKMHMVFYFSAGKGCVFQVPRGNYYSFANTYSKDARLFFTQGCVPTEGDDTPGSASKTDTLDGEATTPVARPKATKGRPKGKQKAAGA
ncbi:hypothetical protein ARAM_007426 [Aspergillus rambellii]|uniref:Cupin domain protein n=1 Tax=Aspergillus rambellii TaxID=308745 RepID=A0A0F8WWU5_9EURO|nr:hypothetical protein ARAM_007426 [Aspergillus rambellii]